jgi:hypothetical protein
MMTENKNKRREEMTENEILQWELESVRDIQFGSDISSQLAFEVAYTALRARIRGSINRLAETWPRMDRFTFTKIAELIIREEMLKYE